MKFYRAYLCNFVLNLFIIKVKLELDDLNMKVCVKINLLFMHGILANEDFKEIFLHLLLILL